MHFNIIGAGRLGKLIALALVGSGLAQLGAVCNKSFRSAKKTIEQIGSGLAVSELTELPSADITFITTPDDLISPIALTLAKEKRIPPGSIVVHASGVLSSTVLKPLQELGCQIASIHPLKACRANALRENSFKNCDCIVEGDEAALRIISLLFAQLGARIIAIKPEKKAIYHAAAVFASNYMVTLAATSIELFKQAGMTADLAKQMTTNLMFSSFNNIQQANAIAEALTGPLLRGDLNTLNLHLHALPKGVTHDFYRIAALATLPLTTLSEEQKSQVQDLLGI